jgi:hypothetical protein
MAKKSFRDRYFEALGLNPMVDQKENATKLSAALARAHDIRKFEIELYWKRATYFWAFQAVAFAALGFLFKDGSIPKPELIIIPAMIGFVTAVGGYLTARGSKFWQENWEAHVDLLEPSIAGRLTQVIVSRDGPQFSVSRVNQWLLGVLAGAWVVPLAWTAYPQLGDLFLVLPLETRQVIPLLVALLIAGGIFWLSRTELRGQIYRQGAEHWADYRPNKKKSGALLIWRDPAGGKPPNCPPHPNKSRVV